MINIIQELGFCLKHVYNNYKITTLYTNLFVVTIKPLLLKQRIIQLFFNRLNTFILLIRNVYNQLIVVCVKINDLQHWNIIYVYTQ